jgi:hypothetical protein
LTSLRSRLRVRARRYYVLATARPRSLISWPALQATTIGRVTSSVLHSAASRQPAPGNKCGVPYTSRRTPDDLRRVLRLSHSRGLSIKSRNLETA